MNPFETRLAELERLVEALTERVNNLEGNRTSSIQDRARVLAAKMKRSQKQEQLQLLALIADEVGLDPTEVEITKIQGRVQQKGTTPR